MMERREVLGALWALFAGVVVPQWRPSLWVSANHGTLASDDALAGLAYTTECLLRDATEITIYFGSHETVIDAVWDGVTWVNRPPSPVRERTDASPFVVLPRRSS